MKFAQFNRFAIEMSDEAVDACSHSGDCEADVKFHAPNIIRTPDITPELLATELKDYGAWTDEELKDDAQNWIRAVWIGAGMIKDGDFAREFEEEEKSRIK